jgi:hypothetical protein
MIVLESVCGNQFHDETSIEFPLENPNEQVCLCYLGEIRL